MMDRRLWRGLALVVAIATIGAAIWSSPLRRELDPAGLAAWAREQGQAWWAVPAYFVAYIVLTVLFIPTQALSIAGVLIWGWWRGGIIELFAATVASIFPFLITRGTLRDAVTARLAGHRKIADVLAREGFTLLLVLRVIPILPYTILNYVAGLSSLRLLSYVAASLLGMIPSVFVFAYFVDAVARGVMNPREVALRIFIAGALLAALIVATRLAAPRLRRRLGEPPRGE